MFDTAENAANASAQFSDCAISTDVSSEMSSLVGSETELPGPVAPPDSDVDEHALRTDVSARQQTNNLVLRLITVPD